MKILVTGAKDFVGRNLCAALEEIRNGHDKRPDHELPGGVEAIFAYDVDNSPEELDAWCAECDFVANLAGVNRPKDAAEFMKGNFGFASTLLDTLKKHHNKCPVMLSSSTQATLQGRFAGSEYGKSKAAGEKLQQAGYKLAEIVYSDQQAQTAPGSGNGDDVVDAEYEVVDDN